MKGSEGDDGDDGMMGDPGFPGKSGLLVRNYYYDDRVYSVSVSNVCSCVYRVHLDEKDHLENQDKME